VDPTREEPQGNVYGGEEQHDEHRHLNERAGLFCAQEHRHATSPQHRHQIHHHAQPDEAHEFDAAPRDVHAREQRRDRDHDGRQQPAHERSHRVAGDDPAAARGAQQQAPRKPRVEVAGDREAGEDTAERRRLQEDERELERGVAGLVVEVGHV
jgi:hypothetical protein